MKNIVVVCLLLVFLFPMLVKGQGKQACRLSIEGTVQQPSCQGGMDGAIRLQVSGGTAPYTYHWSSGQEASDINQLTAGTYRVTVQDSEGCITTAEFPLTAQIKDLSIQVKQQTAALDSKTLQVRFAGNVEPYAIYIKKISEGLQVPQISYKGQALNKGTYLLEAFTEEGCSTMQKIRIDAN